jgi:TolB-like protein
MIQDPPNQAASGSHVFVSYASQDAAVANSIVENLESHGLKCWIAPRDVKAGAVYADAIVRAINDANALVLILSTSAMASSHVGREVERAASKRKQIVAFRLDGAALSPELEYFLSNSQWIDVPQLGMPAALVKLKEAVGHVSTASPQVAPPVAAPVRSWGGIKKRAATVVSAAVIGVGAAVGLGLHFWPHGRSGAQAPSVAVISDKSIAVLPFTDMSEKKDQEYFADGMAEEIIDLLVKIPGLKVISRTSSFQFKGKTEDLRSIGTQLGVAYVLEGSVRKSGDRLRVTAQLIDSRDGTQLFSQTYDRDLSDVLKLQDEIALALVRALQIEVGAAYVSSRPALRNTQPYTLYLQGLHAFDRVDQQGFEQAASDFQQALDLDPSFAAAANMLSASNFVLGQFGFMPPAAPFEKARQAAQHASELDPDLAGAHAHLAEVYRAADRDWEAADREIRLARALAPNDPDVLLISAVQAENLGRWEDALKFVNTSLARDPLNATAYMVLNHIQLGRGRLEEAEAAIRRTLELNPLFTRAHYFLGCVLLARGEPQAALVEMLKGKQDRTRLSGSAMAYFALGRKADSDAALAQMLKNEAAHPYFVAQIYAFRGETDEALRWLDRAYVQKDPELVLLKSQAKLVKLEGDPRYKAILKKMNLPYD